MKRMVDRLWCPECHTDRHQSDHSDYPPTCRNCDTGLTSPPVRVKAIWRMKQGAAISILTAIFFGPIVWVVINFGERPLYATKTVEVTTTQPYGLIPGVAPFLVLWILLYIAGWSALGGFPRP